MLLFVRYRSIGWRLGLQALTGIVFSTFILGIFYRPASLYHPQRRAILHLKSMQKRLVEIVKKIEFVSPVQLGTRLICVI